MKIDNKGFTFVEILAVILIISLLTGLSIAAFSRYKNNAIESDFEALAKSSYHAMKEHMMDHPYDDTATLETLEEENLLSNRKDPGSKEDCTGTVEVKKNAGTNGKIDDGEYTVNLCCVTDQRTYTYPDGKSKKLTDRSKCTYVPEEEPEEPPTPPTPPSPGTSVTLNYNDNGGSGCSSKSISKNPGEAWGSLCTPTRSGYAFNGWKNGSEVITSSSIANENITVSAVWIPFKCTINYNNNGGTFNNNSTNTTKVINYGDNIKLNEPLTYYAASKTWYTISNDKAWIDSNNTIYNITNTYSASDICGDRLNTSDTSVTLKANWRLTRINITYNSNGGSLVPCEKCVCPEAAGCTKSNCVWPQNVSCTGNKKGNIFKYSKPNTTTDWAADGVRNYVKTDDNQPTLLLKKNSKCGNGYWYVNKPNSSIRIYEDKKFATGKKLAQALDKNNTYYNTLMHEDISVTFYASSFENKKLCP